MGLLLIEGQVLEALRERQLLLDGHAQEGVQGLLLVLGCSQLPLHLIQLCDVLVTSADVQKQTNKSSRKVEQQRAKKSRDRKEKHIKS